MTTNPPCFDMNKSVPTPDLRLPASSSRAGFTLVEILVVVTIILLLSGIVLQNIVGGMAKGELAAAKAQIQALSSAVTEYRMSHGRYPTTQQGLQALVEKPTREPIPPNYPEGGHLNSRVLPLDPWKRPYLYLCPGRQREPFEVFSYGADGEPGGEGANADVSSANPN